MREFDEARRQNGVSSFCRILGADPLPELFCLDRIFELIQAIGSENRLVSTTEMGVIPLENEIFGKTHSAIRTQSGEQEQLLFLMIGLESFHSLIISSRQAKGFAAEGSPEVYPILALPPDEKHSYDQRLHGIKLARHLEWRSTERIRPRRSALTGERTL